jgi:hypothetical protein
MHKNFARTASLAICASITHETRGASASDLTEKYMAVLSRRITPNVASAGRLEAFIGRRSQIRKYSKSGGPQTLELISERLKSGKQSIELHDWFLSDESLQSQSGTERNTTADRTIALCGELGILRLPGGTLQSVGKILVRVANESGMLPIDEAMTQNPFEPRPAIIAIVLYQLLKNDLAFVRGLLPEFAAGYSPFYKGFGLNYKEILDRVEKTTVRTMANRDEFRWLDNQKNFAKRLQAKVNPNEISSNETLESAYRPASDALLPRCEILVDAGVLSKATPTENTFKLTDCGVEFTEKISHPNFNIEHDFFSAFSIISGVKSAKVEDEALIDHLNSAYGYLRNLAKYAPIAETVLLSNAQSLLDGTGGVIEISKAKSILNEIATRSHSPVRIVADRHRKPSAYRYEERVN